MGDQPNAAHDGKQKECSDCEAFADAPIVGHFKCVAHRACTSSQEWQPNNCDMCMYFKHTVSQQPAEERNANIDELVNMLQEASAQLSCSETKWEYEDTLYSFMELERPETQPNQSETLEGENPEKSGRHREPNPTTAIS